jgi:hypothetical protein
MLVHPAAMQPLTHLQLAIWLLSPMLQALVAIVMVRKKLFREMPLFFTYTVCHSLSACILFLLLKTSWAAFFYSYWGSEIVDALLTFLVIQEVFSTVFRPYEAIRSLGIWLFRCLLLGLIAVTIVMAPGSAPSGFDRLVSSLFIVQRSILFVQAGLIFFLILSSRLFGLTWRNYVFGVALGFGAMACVAGLGVALRSRVPAPIDDWLVTVVPFGYIFGVAVWASYMLMPSSSQKVDRSEIDVSPLKGWNRALERMLDR